MNPAYHVSEKRTENMGGIKLRGIVYSSSFNISLPGGLRMKLMRIIAASMIVGLSSLLFIGASCESGPEYYFTFKADGQELTYEQGLDDIESAAFGNIISVTGEALYLFAAPDQGEISASEPDTYTLFIIYETSPGTYISGAGFQPLAALVTLMYRKNGVFYRSNATNGEVTVTVSKIGEVDDVIEGSFQAIVGNSDAGDIQITDGAFRVKRVADESFSGFFK
jgi:hypothetical protein